MAHSEQAGKAETIRTLLEREGRVMLCLDATCKGVDVPRRFASDTGLRLILNKKMPQSIDIGPKTIESELRFGGIPHYCIIPYEALWGAFNPDSGHGMLWAESMPENVRKSYASAVNPIGAGQPRIVQGSGVEGATPEATAEDASGEGSSKGEANRPRLEVINGAADQTTRNDAPKKDRPPASKSHLRLVE